LHVFYIVGFKKSKRSKEVAKMSAVDTQSPSTSLSWKDKMLLVVEREGNRRLRRLGTALYRLTHGRIAPRNRDVLLLTTRGRKSGREHTVLLQSFPDGANMLVVAANPGGLADPDWLCNLRATPTARIEIRGRSQWVRAEQLSAEEAAIFWPAILQRAPTYHRYLKATRRTIPLVRLVPITPGEGGSL
jgi:deazaflavin-dependent oxidoreductase (nitroreductase family)